MKIFTLDMNRALRPVTCLMTSKYVPSNLAHEHQLRVKVLIKLIFSAMINRVPATRSMSTE